MPNPVPRGPVTPPKSPKEEAELITGFLKGSLQAARVAALSVGKLLAVVRDRKLFEALGHPDLESYARARLQLGKTSLYYYLKVFDYVQPRHPEWLAPGPGTFIPDLNDLLGLIWLDKELEKPGLPADRREELSELKTKAEKGTLRKNELARFRAAGRGEEGDDARKAFLEQLRKLRETGARIREMPPEIVEGLDDLSALLNNALKTQPAMSRLGQKRSKVA